MKQLLARLVRVSPALVVAMLALLVALGGVSTAAQIQSPQASEAKSAQQHVGKRGEARPARPTWSSRTGGPAGGGTGPAGVQGPAGAPGQTGAQGPAGAPNPNAVDSDKVDGLHANEITRAAGIHVVDPDVDNWNGAAITDSRSITAPRAGYLLISYTINFSNDQDETGSGRGYFTFDPKLNGTTIGDTAGSSIDFTDVCCDYRTHALQRFVQVAPGTHTVAVSATGPGGTRLAYIFERSLTVLFVPFGGTGVAP